MKDFHGGAFDKAKLDQTALQFFRRQASAARDGHDRSDPAVMLDFSAARSARKGE